MGMLIQLASMIYECYVRLYCSLLNLNTAHVAKPFLRLHTTIKVVVTQFKNAVCIVFRNTVIQC